MLLWETHLCYSTMRSPSLEYVNVLFDIRAVFIFSISFTLKDNHVVLKGKEFHVMLLWETHLCYCDMQSCYSEYVTLLWEVTAVFIFSVEALHWKITTLIWKGKDFMKCFCEKRTCVSKKWGALVWNMSKFCSKLEKCSFSI